jgi:hypothetical protein
MKKRAEKAFTENRKNNNCFNNLFIKQKCHNISNLYINDNNSNNIIRYYEIFEFMFFNASKNE